MRKKLLLIVVLTVLSISVSLNGLKLNTVAEREIGNTIPPPTAISLPIHINGNQEWGNFRNAGNCTGQGTSPDPYVIENLEIDGEGSESGILIENSDVYFKIENIEIKNSTGTNDAGIKLVNVSNGQLINNIANNNNHGIFLNYSRNNIFSGNTINNNDHRGIYIYSSSNNTFSENTINNNHHRGIYIYHSFNNTFSENTINNNTNYGIFIKYSHNNTITRNMISNNVFRGISLETSNNNTFTGNTINNCDVGIDLKYGLNNIISGNIITNNDYWGISIELNSKWNLIYLNCFNNPTNVHKAVINNSWDNGTKGNFWSDYDGSDAGGDGIGDTPYIADQDNIAQDNFPLIKCPLSDQENTILGYDPFFLIGMIGLTAFILLLRAKNSFKESTIKT